MVQPPVIVMVQPIATHSAPPGIVCRICVDGFEEVNSKNITIRATPYCHLFCEPCIMRAVAMIQHGPLCRDNKEMKDQIRIYI